MAKLNIVRIVTSIAGLAAGGVGAKVVIRKIAPNMDPKLKSIGAIILGAVIPELSRNPLLQKVGDGMTAVAAAELVGNIVPALAGVQDDDNLDTSIGLGDDYVSDQEDEDAVHGIDDKNEDNAIGGTEG